MMAPAPKVRARCDATVPIVSLTQCWITRLVGSWPVAQRATCSGCLTAHCSDASTPTHTHTPNTVERRLRASALLADGHYHRHPYRTSGMERLAALQL